MSINTTDQPFDSASAHAAFLKEAETFKQLKSTLLQEYRGKFVAIYDGQVVAVGENRMDVYGVVLETLGQVSCYIGLVDDETPQPKRIPSIWKVR